MNKRERISDFVRSLENGSTNHDYYAAFFVLWNQRRYYEAHDVLEQLWLAEGNPISARFYQALIQAAGAFVHLQKNFDHPDHPKHRRRLRPASRLFALALGNLEDLPDKFHTLNVANFRRLLTHYRDELTSSQYSRNPWSPEKAPKVFLLLGSDPG